MIKRKIRIVVAAAFIVVLVVMAIHLKEQRDSPVQIDQLIKPVEASFKCAITWRMISADSHDSESNAKRKKDELIQKDLDIFKCEFSRILKDDHLKIRPDVAVALIFPYTIAFSTPEGIVEYDFDPGDEIDAPIVAYGVGDDCGIITLSRSGSDSLLELIQDGRMRF